MTAVALLLGKDLRRSSARRSSSPRSSSTRCSWRSSSASSSGTPASDRGSPSSIARPPPDDRARRTAASTLAQLFEQASEVDLVRMSPDRAERELETGQVLAVLTVPEDFTCACAACARARR